MFCSVCNSSSQGSPEARRVLPSIANRVGDQVADRVGGDHPQTKAHLGEKQKLQTEGVGAPWKFAKADLWRLARQSLKKTSNFDRQACRAHPPIRESFWQSFFSSCLLHWVLEGGLLNRKISTSGGEIEDGAHCQLSDGSIHFLWARLHWNHTGGRFPPWST